MPLTTLFSHSTTRCAAWLAAAALTLGAADAARAADGAAIPDGAALEEAGAIIGEITFERHNVFDLSIPEENNALYRLANRLHIVTREPVLRQQLLFASGDPYVQRLVDETERVLRRNDYLYDARIRPVRYHDGVVDLVVETRDLWTLMPGISVSRSGGENRARVSISEQNLLGGGAHVKMAYTDDVDRESTSFEYFDANLGDSWTTLRLRAEDNSDGAVHLAHLGQPFYALDTRWAGGVDFLRTDAETRFYELGEEVAEYRAERRIGNVFVGWSDGLQDGWVTRYTGGITVEESRFLPTVAQALPQLLPANRELFYPWVGVERIENRYETSSNRDQIDRTEDFFLGARVAARLGFASESLGSDRDALLFRVNASRGFGSISDEALLLSTRLSGRAEQGSLVNALWHADSRYYKQLGEKQLFFMTLSASVGHDLDLDNVLSLGGDSGLRGYPLRYQVGEQRLLFTIEYRYFTDWNPFRLVRIGGAVFADAGRTWGDNPAGGPPLGWLRDVGVGLRLMPTRASGREVVHLDLAFPLDGDPSIDDVQILLEKKGSF